MYAPIVMHKIIYILNTFNGVNMQGFREDVCLVFFYSNDDFTYYSFVKYVCSMRLDVNGGSKVRNSEILS